MYFSRVLSRANQRHFNYIVNLTYYHFLIYSKLFHPYGVKFSLKVETKIVDYLNGTREGVNVMENMSQRASLNLNDARAAIYTRHVRNVLKLATGY